MTKNFEKFFPGKHIIKMNSNTVRKLRSIAENKGLHGYYKLRKANLVANLKKCLRQHRGARGKKEGL